MDGDNALMYLSHYSNFFSMSLTPLEQFNEEVMREFQDEFKQMFEDLSEDKELYFKHVFNNFITQKLTEQKELILMEVKERSYARLKNVDVLDWDRFEDILDEIKY